MTLDAGDKAALTGVRMIYGAPKVADLVEAMDAQYGNLPAMKEVNKTFTALAKADPSKLKALNTVLEKNQDLAKKIMANLGKDPEAFRTSFLPAVFKNPESALTLVNQQPKPQAAPATQTAGAQAKPAPITRTYDDKPEALEVAAARQPAGTAIARTSAPDKTAEARLATKMEQLTKVEGYTELMDRVSKNPTLGDAVKAMMAGNGSAKDQEEAVDKILAKTKEDPKLFKTLVKRIDDNPGAVSTFAGMVANDPKNALNMISSLANDEGPVGMMGLFGGMMKNGKFDLGGMMNGFLGNLSGPQGGMLGMIITAIMGFVGKLFGGGTHMVLGSNVGMTQYDESVRATNAKPSAVLGPDAQPVLAVQGATTTQDKARTVATPTQPA